jgi:hypothetical protein
MGRSLEDGFRGGHGANSEDEKFAEWEHPKCLSYLCDQSHNLNQIVPTYEPLRNSAGCQVLPPER